MFKAVYCLARSNLVLWLTGHITAEPHGVHPLVDLCMCGHLGPAKCGGPCDVIAKAPQRTSEQLIFGVSTKH